MAMQALHAGTNRLQRPQKSFSEIHLRVRIRVPRILGHRTGIGIETGRLLNRMSPPGAIGLRPYMGSLLAAGRSSNPLTYYTLFDRVVKR